MSAVLTGTLALGCAAALGAAPSADAEVYVAQATRQPEPLDLSNVPTREVTPTATIATGLDPIITTMTVADGRVWATSFNGMVAIDPATNQVTWVTDTPAADVTGLDDQVVRDAGQRGVVEMWDAHTSSLRWSDPAEEPAGTAIVGDQIWTADHHGGSLSIRRGADGALIGEVRVGPRGANGPQMPLAAHRSILVTDYKIHKVVVVDPASRQVTARVDVPQAVKFCQKPSLAAGSGIWISDCSTMITRIDAGSLERATVDAGTDPGTPLAVAGQAWVPLDGRIVHLTDGLRADRAVSVAGQQHVYAGVVAFGSAWINVGAGVISRVPAPQDW